MAIHSLASATTPRAGRSAVASTTPTPRLTTGSITPQLKPNLPNGHSRAPGFPTQPCQDERSRLRAGQWLGLKGKRAQGARMGIVLSSRIAGERLCLVDAARITRC